VLIPAAAAQAHPLGNFTVNHYDGLQLYPDRIDVLSIVDTAEIPTAQDLQALAPDGRPTEQQLDDAAAVQCTDLSGDVTAAVDGLPLTWTIRSSALETRPGAAGLPTLRLTCELRAAAALNRPRTIDFADNYRGDRVGWHEITANGTGVRLLDPPVGATSISDELRTYPTDLLTSPLDQRSVQLITEPGENVASDLRVSSSSGDPFSSFIASMDRFLQDLIGGELTLWVGTLAVLLAVLLGSAHALLPGHGKTMIAAYLAARSGRRGDAFIVAGTVTATHTAGVLLLGVAISVSSALAGEQVLRWLGIISGLLVASIGVFMLRMALRTRRARRQPSSGRSPAAQTPALVGSQVGTGQSQFIDHEHDHTHELERDSSNDGQPHRDHRPHDHGLGPHEHAHDHGSAGAPHDHAHDHDPAHSHAHGGSWWAGGHSNEPAVGRGGLIGMGVAGGLVPSPSALIVLVASIALGRTVFGVFLVVAYGLGMAATLSVAGLILVRLRGRLEQRAARADPTDGRNTIAVISAALPILTAALVLVVGLALALRGLLLTA
jgi:ABC-type nickel/cobalt efflux system permease component RcnA